MSSSRYVTYFTTLVERLRGTHLARREDEIAAEEDNNRQNDPALTDEPPEVEEVNSPLKITGCSFYSEENGKLHRTNQFQLVERGTPVFRRGQSFFMALVFHDEREFEPGSDKVYLTFSLGPIPSISKGTKFVIPVRTETFSEDDLKSSEWIARLKTVDKHAITVEVKSTSDCCVGLWKCRVMMKNNSTASFTYPCPDDVYMLFNPWEITDTTYMTESELLDEYILEEVGKIWIGSYSATRGRDWVFGQFDDSVLPLLMILLEKSGLPFSARGNPISVSRALSKIVNWNDDDGVLVGRWDGEYKDGTAPAEWTGSVPIIEQYFQTMKPVMYGQCWVFSGVLATFCRAIGLPCRVVSNLVSAHDANGTLTIDRYFDSENNEINHDPHNPNGGKDSIWNFHVWNEVWFARPDLPKGYGGWQAIDATPQEPSDGFYQCGPASVEAVKRGLVGFAYDVPFVLAEVNADVVRWREDASSALGFSRMNSNKYHVGRHIFTKKPNEFDADGDSDRMDVIGNYKADEGSTTERLQLVNAVRGSRRKSAAHFFDLDSKVEDVTFQLIDLEEVPIGKPFTMIINIQNNSNEERSVQANLSADSMYYNGIRKETVKKAAGTFSIAPDSREELRLTVTAGEYMDKLAEYGIMKIFALCAVKETNQSWCEEDDFQVIKPKLQIIITEKVRTGRPSYATFSFTNPLDTSLTNCKLHYEGPGMSRFAKINLPDIGPWEEFKYTHRLVPRNVGKHRLVVNFSSDQLIDVTGSTLIDVI